MKYLAVLCLLAAALLQPVSAFAAQDFSLWLQDFKAEARAEGISQHTLDEAFAGVLPIDRVIELDRKQPEGHMTFVQYRERVINDNRIRQGRRLLSENYALLQEISRQYGVPPQYIVALWGIETSYGNNTGGFGVIPALATLAYDGRRSSFFRKELLGALKIIEGGHIDAAHMKGSWAGAMGQNQFMPSSFHAYAVDGNGDGRRDIWGTKADVFASTANYLSRNGWKGDERWGRPVRLPEGFPADKTGLEYKHSLQYWRDAGVTLEYGSPIPVVDGMKGAVVLPDGVGGPAFLVYDNYGVIMRWNKSLYFATSVGLLADAIAR